MLTGTPIENSLKDLWAQFHFLQPDLLGNESAFTKQFINPIKQGNSRMELRLRQLITPFILRRSKSEVAPELPPLTEEIIYCDMPESQDEIYLQEKNSLRNTLLQLSPNKKQHQQFTVLNGISRLRQLACHPRMIFSDYEGSSGKLEQIIDGTGYNIMSTLDGSSTLWTLRHGTQAWQRTADSGTEWLFLTLTCSTAFSTVVLEVGGNG